MCTDYGYVLGSMQLVEISVCRMESLTMAGRNQEAKRLGLRAYRGRQ